MFEANRGTRNEAEAAALMLERASQHMSDHFDGDAVPNPSTHGALLASIVLLELSLLVFPEQETKVRRGGL